MLYRCSMTIRLIMNYHANSPKRASVTRLDLHCQKMEFSMTEQQIPMLLRLVALLKALQSKQFPANKEKSLIALEERETTDEGRIFIFSKCENKYVYHKNKFVCILILVSIYISIHLHDYLLTCLFMSSLNCTRL